MRRSRATVLVTTGVLVATGFLLAGGVFVLACPRTGDAPAAAATPSLTVTRIQRTDLTDARLLPGTLGFGTPRTIKGTGSGVLTKLPATGTKTTRGAALFRVDDQPVVVLYGDTPIFRNIDKPGLEGHDVRELRTNLTALGYRTRSSRPAVSDTALIAALKRWQSDLDLPGPGILRPGQAVVLPGAARVSALAATLGDPADGPVLSVTSEARVVEVPMSPTDTGRVHGGDQVTVALPDGRETPGRVTGISRTVTANDSEPAKVTVIVVPARPADVAAYDAAPVQVRFTAVTRKNVLAVPVGALIALREGGYAVQRPDGSLTPAATGLFAGGMVEVSGPGLAEGATVVTTP